MLKRCHVRKRRIEWDFDGDDNENDDSSIHSSASYMLDEDFGENDDGADENDALLDEKNTIFEQELIDLLGINCHDLQHAGTLQGQDLRDFLDSKFPSVQEGESDEDEENRIKAGFILHTTSNNTQQRAATMAGCSAFQIAR